MPLTPQTLETLSRLVYGFEYEGSTSLRRTYIFFDPQCPHCARLWAMMPALVRDSKFVWIPVAIMNTASKAQAKTILAAADRQATMSEHERLITLRRGGISAQTNLNPDFDVMIDQNLAVFKALKANSVPLIVGFNSATGAPVIQSGVGSARELQQLMGWI